MVLIALSLILAMLVVLLIQAWGFSSTVSTVLLTTVSLLPQTLIASENVKHVGIATITPSLTTYGAVSLAGAVTLICVGRVTAGALIWLPLGLWLTFGMAYLWVGNPEQWSGVLQLSLAPAAWIVGAATVGRAYSSPIHAKRTVGVIGGIVLLQLVVCVLQAGGISLNAMDASQEALLAGRFNGTLGHPNDLGKVILFLIVLLLALIPSLDQRMKRLVVVIFAASFAVLALTGGRAVTIGALVAVVLWAMLLPVDAGARNRKLTVLAGAGVAGLMVAGVLFARFDEDPTGGDRSPLVSVALQQIGLRPFAGVGPNSYVSIVGQFDALTASGVPVHNAVLLAAAELGVPGAVALLLPCMTLFIGGLRVMKENSERGAAARAVVAGTPALCLIAMTGWGLLGGYVLPLMFFTVGALQAALREGGSRVSGTPLLPGTLVESSRNS